MYIHMVVLILNNCWHQVASVHYLARPPTRPFGPFAGPKRKASPQSPHALQRRCGATPLLGTWEMSSGFPMACSLENDIATKVSHGLTISHHHIASKILMIGNRSSIHWGQIYQRHRQIISDLPTAPASCWRGWKHFHQGRAFHGQRRQWHWRCDGNAHHHRAKGSWRSWRKQKLLQDGHLRTRKRWGSWGKTGFVMLYPRDSRWFEKSTKIYLTTWSSASFPKFCSGSCSHAGVVWGSTIYPLVN